MWTTEAGSFSLAVALRPRTNAGCGNFPADRSNLVRNLRKHLREMREEYGVEIIVGELLDVVDHILTEEGQHWVSPTFICTITSGTPAIREPGKCAEIGWFYPDEMPDDGLTQITRVNLTHYRQRLRAR